MREFFIAIPSFLKTLYAYSWSIYRFVFITEMSTLLDPLRNIGVIGNVISWLLGTGWIGATLGDLTLFEFAVGSGSVFFIGFCFVKFVFDIIF